MSVMTALPYSPSSPGVAARRRKVPNIPRLPLSAFTPPNSGCGDGFGLASANTLRPDAVIDANVACSLSDWKAQASGELAQKVQAVVLALHGSSPELTAAVTAAQKEATVFAVSVPFPLEDGVPDQSTLPVFLSSPPPNLAIALRTTFKTFSPQLADGIHWAVSRGLVVDIDVQTDLASDGGWDSVDELVSSALNPDRPQSNAATKRGSIVLSNLLPAPHGLSIPLVKLMTHSLYRTFQTSMASISLFPAVSIKFLPPPWIVPTPAASFLDGEPQESKERNETKRRIKLYLGHAVEAFGYQRLIFGSSPSSASATVTSAGDWYELARECLSELCLEQDAMDGIFAQNARNVYAV